MREIDLQFLRRQFIVALASDDVLLNLLVLKGGNALSIVHGIGLRASVDLDYSLEGEPADPTKFGERVLDALSRHLERHGYRVFDGAFKPRPTARRPGLEAKWGGYTATFKLLRHGDFEAHRGDIDRSRRQALPVRADPQAGRTFRIEISNYEYCEDKTRCPVEEGTSCYVYTPAMIGAEKLRALCQQMDEYGKRAHPAPRGRDFYDLHALLTEGAVELSEERTHDLVRAVFGAKDVPLALLGRLESYREFHRSDWPAVQNAIPATRSREYDFYVDFVVAEVRKLEPLWEVDPP